MRILILDDEFHARYKVVPREPTEAMVATGNQERGWGAKHVYRAMLAAAPEIKGVELPPYRTQTEDERRHPDAHYECGLTDGWNEYRDAIIRSKP